MKILIKKIIIKILKNYSCFEINTKKKNFKVLNFIQKTTKNLDIFSQVQISGKKIRLMKLKKKLKISCY